jgi:membrane-associated phospholipid phosphatase
MSGRPLTWPTWRRFAVGVIGALVVSLAFFPIYVGGMAFAALRGHPAHLYASFELGIPFWPAMIVPYLSMFILFLIPPLQLEPGELTDLVRRLVIASLIAGVVFLLLPSEIGFADRTDAGSWQPIYDAVYAIDGRFNAAPSLHVIYTASILLAFIDVASPRLRVAYAAWLVLVCASTVLTHRHHLIDVVSGLAVALAVRALLRGPAPSVLSPEMSR